MAEANEPKVGEVRVAGSDGAEMVHVPAGWFVQGSPDDEPGADPDEHPQRRVYLDAFWIDRHEVTNRRYAAFARSTGHRAPLYWEGGEIPEGHEEYPVVGVSWADARAYAAWAGKRLPTEAQWEKAARGEHGALYPWGNEWEEARANNTARMASVGSHPGDESPYGCLDMAGNAWEWCRDWYNLYVRYDQYPDHNPTGTEEWHRYWYRGTHFRAVRGGYYTDGSPARAADRTGDVPPETRYWAIGFRCAAGEVPTSVNADYREEPEETKAVKAPVSAVRPRRGRLARVILPSFEVEVGHPVMVEQSKGFENGDLGYYHCIRYFERLADGSLCLGFTVHPDAYGPYPPIDTANLGSGCSTHWDYPSAVRVSMDDGRTWDEPNPPMAIEGKVLSDGTLMSVRVWGWRPEGGGTAMVHISHDGGRTVSVSRGIELDTGGLDVECLYMHPESSLVQMPGGELLSATVSKLVGDPCWKNILLRSDDLGTSWRYVSTIMSDPLPGYRGYTEETALRLCPGGDLLAITRTVPSDRVFRRMAQARSFDGGLTWSPPRHVPDIPGVLWPFRAGNVSPDLVGLSDDVLALGYGRPAGLMVAFCPDGRGEHWEPLTLMGVMGEGLLEQEYGAMTANSMAIPGNQGMYLSNSHHMTRLLALGENRFLIAYHIERYCPFVIEDADTKDLIAPDPDYQPRNTVFVLPITVERRA